MTDLLINGLRSCYIERLGVLEEIPNPFKSARELFDFVERLLLPTGRRIDGAQPVVDGHLEGGGRFHLVMPPLVEGEAHISLRFLSKSRISIDSFAAPATIELLTDHLRAKKNLLITGATGSGKTTLLGLLLDRVAVEERVLILEETREIVTSLPHVVRLEGRPPSPEGMGGVTLRTLFRNALRMRPDRIVLGECRGGEALDMVQAMGSGHAGSLSTLHSEGGRQALLRLEGLVLMSGFAPNTGVVRQWIASSLGVVVFMDRRKIASVYELQGLEGEAYRLHQLHP